MKHLLRFVLLACLMVTQHAGATDYFVNPTGKFQSFCRFLAQQSVLINHQQLPNILLRGIVIQIR
jgi:hypothetical protein